MSKIRQQLKLVRNVGPQIVHAIVVIIRRLYLCLDQRYTTVIFDHPQKAKMRVAAAKALFPFPATNNKGVIGGNSQVIMNGIGDSSRHTSHIPTRERVQAFPSFPNQYSGLDHITRREGCPLYLYS
jgi:hypothetical protein